MYWVENSFNNNDNPVNLEHCFSIEQGEGDYPRSGYGGYHYRKPNYDYSKPREHYIIFIGIKDKVQWTYKSKDDRDSDLKRINALILKKNQNHE